MIEIRSVIANHITIATYGFWLPNDPRGSWSLFVGSRDLLKYGPASKNASRRSFAGRKHDRSERLAAKEELAFAPVEFTGRDALRVGRAIGEYTSKTGTVVWACAIMPGHVHLVLQRREISAETIARQIKGATTRALVAGGWKHPHVWSRGQWVSYLDDASGVRRAIEYVEQNPVKEGKPLQRWSFVSSYALFRSAREDARG